LSMILVLYSAARPHTIKVPPGAARRAASTVNAPGPGPSSSSRSPGWMLM
jgi:hypothetical protein